MITFTGASLWPISNHIVDRNNDIEWVLMTLIEIMREDMYDSYNYDQNECIKSYCKIKTHHMSVAHRNYDF